MSGGGGSWKILLLRIGDKCPEYNTTDPKEQIDTCYSAIRREFDHSGSDILPFLLQCAEQLPHKIPFYGTLVGLLNMEDEEFVRKFVDAAHRSFQDAFNSENCNKIRCLLRFITVMDGPRNLSNFPGRPCTRRRLLLPLSAAAFTLQASPHSSITSLLIEEKLLRPQPYAAENLLERDLRHSFATNLHLLDPPFPLSIPTPEEYLGLTRAILYSILTERSACGIRIKYLHAIVVDGYASFTALTARIVDELFERLFNVAKEQVMWIADEMVVVGAVGFGDLLVSLLRQIVSGDYGDDNLWLCFEVASLFLRKWSTLLEENEGGSTLCCGVYCFLRLLGDHCRARSSGDVRLSDLRKVEINFCVKMLKEQFSLCMNVGRDLIRLLQDLVHVPEFCEIWKDLVLKPDAFRCHLFSDISQIYRIRTPSRYFLLRVTPEMERHMRFLLTNVKLGGQKRHQAWFWNKFLGVSPERETLVVDLIRFVCCARHPTKEVLRSDIIPRWAVIGWLLKCSRKNYVEANAKLALFYDWLFFDERVDKVMNVEPALLLMVCSLPHYVEITDSLLEFLLLLVDNYDVDRKGLISRGVLTSFEVLTRSGVVPSCNVLTGAEGISPSLKERLGALLSRMEDHSAELVRSTKAINMDIGESVIRSVNSSVCSCA